MTSQFFLSLAILLSSFIASKILKRFLRKIGRSKNVLPKRMFYIDKVFDLLFFITTFMILSFIWSVDIKGLSLFASSAFAVVGVALFAQWSILSNVTASLIIFFTFPARIGDHIRIVDGDDSVEGVIKEITLFQIEITNKEGHAVFYPNNLLLQKPVVKLK